MLEITASLRKVQDNLKPNLEVDNIMLNEKVHKMSTEIHRLTAHVTQHERRLNEYRATDANKNIIDFVDISEAEEDVSISDLFDIPSNKNKDINNPFRRGDKHKPAVNEGINNRKGNHLRKGNIPQGDNDAINKIKNKSNVYISNLPSKITESSINNYFGEFGVISSCIIVHKKNIAFIRYQRSVDARAAITGRNNFKLHGKIIINCALSIRAYTPHESLSEDKLAVSKPNFRARK